MTNNHHNRTAASLTKQTLAELADRYTGLPDGYRRAVQNADMPTLRRVLSLAQSDAAGSEISEALGITA